jgi:hypothetical protein
MKNQRRITESFKEDVVFEMHTEEGVEFGQ